MGAQILKVPELQLSEAEAKKLDAAITEVMQFYTDVELSPVVQAWLNLAMVGGVLYGPRWMAYNIRQKQAKVIEGVRQSSAPPPVSQPGATPAGQAAQSNVTPFRPPAPTKPDTPPAKPHVQQAPALSPQDWSRWNAQSAVISTAE